MDNSNTVPIIGGFVDAGGHSSDPQTRVDNTQAAALGGSGGTDRTSLEVTNMPQHEHDFRAINSSGVKGGNQYHAVRLDTASPPGIEPTVGAFLSRGPSTPGQMQYLPSSGGIKTTGSLGLPVAIMNPYLTLNYIIRSGPAIF
jgi:microcystin-dependent protein